MIFYKEVCPKSVQNLRKYAEHDLIAFLLQILKSKTILCEIPLIFQIPQS